MSLDLILSAVFVLSTIILVGFAVVRGRFWIGEEPQWLVDRKERPIVYWILLAVLVCAFGYFDWSFIRDYF